MGEVGCGAQGWGEFGIEQGPGLVGFLEFFTQSLEGGLGEMRGLQRAEARCDPGGCSPSGIFPWRVARGLIEPFLALGRAALLPQALDHLGPFEGFEGLLGDAK